MRKIFFLMMGVLAFTCSSGQLTKDIDSIQIENGLLLESIDAKYQRVNGLVDKATGLPMQKLGA